MTQEKRQQYLVQELRKNLSIPYTTESLCKYRTATYRLTSSNLSRINKLGYFKVTCLVARMLFHAFHQLYGVLKTIRLGNISDLCKSNHRSTCTIPPPQKKNSIKTRVRNVLATFTVRVKNQKKAFYLFFEFIFIFFKFMFVLDVISLLFSRSRTTLP